MTRLSPDDEAALIARIEAALSDSAPFTDAQVQVLLSVAEAHIWRAGLWARIRWVANVIGALGIIGGSVAVLASFVGYEVVRK